MIAANAASATVVCAEAYGDDFVGWDDIKQLDPKADVVLHADSISDLRRMIIGGLPTPREITRMVTNRKEITEHDFEPRWSTMDYARFKACDLGGLPPQLFCSTVF